MKQKSASIAERQSSRNKEQKKMNKSHRPFTWSEKIQALAEKKIVTKLEAEADFECTMLASAENYMDAVTKGVELAMKANGNPIYHVVVPMCDNVGPTKELLFIGTEKAVLMRISKLPNITVIKMGFDKHGMKVNGKRVKLPKIKLPKKAFDLKLEEEPLITQAPAKLLTQAQAKLLLPLFKKISETQREWEKLGLDKVCEHCEHHPLDYKPQITGKEGSHV
jgi:hypothetical protein